jgi:hypothetical protein
MNYDLSDYGMGYDGSLGIGVVKNHLTRMICLTKHEKTSESV